jgi:hypothetical protein
MLEDQKVEAQQVLDELFREGLLPFELFARQLVPTGTRDCQVLFHDSRLHSVKVSYLKAQRFRNVFRAAVLEKVEKIDGPLYRKAKS